MALSPKHQAFVNEYLSCFNSTEAYERVYAPKNRVVSASAGQRLLRNVEIEAAVRERLQEAAMSADEVIMRLAEQARNEHGRYVRPDGSVDIAGLLRDGKGHLIKGFKESKRGQVIVEFYDAQSALVHLGKHHKLFTDNVAHSGSIDVNVVKGYTTVTPDDWDEADKTDSHL